MIANWSQGKTRSPLQPIDDDDRTSGFSKVEVVDLTSARREAMGTPVARLFGEEIGDRFSDLNFGTFKGVNVPYITVMLRTSKA